MFGFGATGQFATGEVGAASAEFIGPDKWMRALSEPVRALPGLKVAAQPFFAFNPQPVVSFSWFEPLTEPVRTRPRSPAALAPFHFWQPAPSPFVATGWFAPLSEPVRSRPGLKPPQQQFFTIDTSVIPLSKLMEWFSAFSEPVRFKIGLGPQQQQFLAAPTQLRPNPATTGILSALETKDAFLAGTAVWDRVISGEIGVIELSFTGSEIGVIERAVSAGTSGVVEMAASPAAGTAVPTVTSAHVSIRII